MYDLKVIARYPFLRDGLHIYGDLKIDDIFTGNEFSEARENAVKMIERSLGEERNIYFSNPKMEILSFYITKLILSALDDPIITMRFATYMRDRIEESIKKEKDNALILDLARSLNVDAYFENEFFKISIFDYISFIGKLGEKYRLFYQRVERGYVKFHSIKDRERIAKILREAFVKKFREDVERIDPPEIVYSALGDEIERIEKIKEEKIPENFERNFGEINMAAFPPCIKDIMKSLEKGMNISHNARFSLVTFLFNIGMPREKILEIFKMVPDYNEKLTEYQVLHITGEKGKTVYSMPKCQTMELYSLCVKNVYNDPLCFKEWMKHPLIYYRLKKRSNAPPDSK